MLSKRGGRNGSWSIPARCDTFGLRRVLLADLPPGDQGCLSIKLVSRLSPCCSGFSALIFFFTPSKKKKWQKSSLKTHNEKGSGSTITFFNFISQGQERGTSSSPLMAISSKWATLRAKRSSFPPGFKSSFPGASSCHFCKGEKNESHLLRRRKASSL